MLLTPTPEGDLAKQLVQIAQPLPQLPVEQLAERPGTGGGDAIRGGRFCRVSGQDAPGGLQVETPVFLVGLQVIALGPFVPGVEEDDAFVPIPRSQGS
jgi:hypothetical protein